MHERGGALITTCKQIGQIIEYQNGALVAGSCNYKTRTKHSKIEANQHGLEGVGAKL